MKFVDRYVAAVRSSNLRSGESHVQSSLDVLGAAGKASKRHPLALAILRVRIDDKHAITQVVDMLTCKAKGKAYRMSTAIDERSASLLALLVLDWYRDQNCRGCSGRRFLETAGTPTLSSRECPKCGGTGKRSFESRIPGGQVELARWLVAELEREEEIAGAAAVKALEPRTENAVRYTSAPSDTLGPTSPSRGAAVAERKSVR